MLDVKCITATSFEEIHTLAVEDVYPALGSSVTGLAALEAERRLAQHGPNAIPEAPGQSLILTFLANFTNAMALLLWVGGVVAILAGQPQLAIAIWMVNVINGTFSFWQEYQAERATAALRRLLPNYARVLRNGQEQRVPAEQLVPGDVLLLSEGEHISADARLVAVAELRVDESTLTGESEPRTKIAGRLAKSSVARADLRNLAFAGTSVVAGTGKAVIFATGSNTEFGRIAHLTQSMGEEPSPLQKELIRATKIITLLAVGIGLLFFVLAVALAGVTLYASFVFTMGIIVAFVPEGLLPTVTLALAMGVQRMAARHALIKRLSAVETLGCTTVICTDKTGVLTKNEMTVRDMWLPGHRLMIHGEGYAPGGQIFCEGRPLAKPVDGDLRLMLLAASLCNDARLLPPDGDTPHWVVLGDPTEAALRVVALDGGLDPDAEVLRTPRLVELPFDSGRKRMSTIHPRPEGGRIAYVKGAPKEVLDLCARVRVDGAERPLSDEMRSEIVAVNDDYARGALRVLAVADRPLPNDLVELTSETVERDLCFLGLMAMMDPPRPEVLEAVAKCHQAGIGVVMITGDYGLTAESIARASGISRGAHPRIVTGSELGSMDDSSLEKVLAGEVIFARVAPEDKLRVVSALQQMGHIVAVTGDGVNDAPALKKADIGVAMGMSGTDVARESADMILTDDNFASIVNAVEEGRAVYDNLRRFAAYVLTSNVAEAVPFIALLFSRGAIPLALTVMQVLSVDLGTDMLPAIGLGNEPAEAGVMSRPPRSRHDPLLSPALLRKVLGFGLIEALAGMSCYLFVNWTHGWPGLPLAPDGTAVYHMATTMTLAGIVAGQIGAVFGYRTDRASIFSVGFFSNRLVLAGVAVEVMLLMVWSYVPPVQLIFNTAPLPLVDWLFAFAWAPIMLAVHEARKLLVRACNR